MLRSVTEQSNYLTPVLVGSAGVCPVCFGAMPASSEQCGNCVDALNRTKGKGQVADVVTPLTYRLGYTSDNQAAHDLRAYKSPRPSSEAQLRLTCLFWYFCGRHLTCVKKRLGISGFTHVAFVPSTRRPGSVHPLQSMLSPMIPLPRAELVLNAGIDPNRRSVHTEWFTAKPVTPVDERPTAVLLIDDTWVSGARAQSAAHCLKNAGAERVATLVLARQVNPDYEPAKPLLAELKGASYDPDSCVWH
ncbi:hypothetical protein [Nocardiopsis sp. NPDC006938]|uniref:hypothetical protein n=1 Tax=Nocardiopsis sp. NPDC006938 TaxID=3364337 RepID=UPI0036C4EAB2